MKLYMKLFQDKYVCIYPSMNIQKYIFMYISTYIISKADKCYKHYKMWKKQHTMFSWINCMKYNYIYVFIVAVFFILQ